MAVGNPEVLVESETIVQTFFISRLSFFLKDRRTIVKVLDCFYVGHSPFLIKESFEFLKDSSADTFRWFEMFPVF